MTLCKGLCKGPVVKGAESMERMASKNHAGQFIAARDYRNRRVKWIQERNRRFYAVPWRVKEDGSKGAKRLSFRSSMRTKTISERKPLRSRIEAVEGSHNYPPRPHMPLRDAAGAVVISCLQMLGVIGAPPRLD